MYANGIFHQIGMMPGDRQRRANLRRRVWQLILLQRDGVGVPRQRERLAVGRHRGARNPVRLGLGGRRS